MIIACVVVWLVDLNVNALLCNCDRVGVHAIFWLRDSFENLSVVLNTNMRRVARRKSKNSIIRQPTRAMAQPINDHQEFDLGDLIDGFALGPDAMELEVDAGLPTPEDSADCGPQCWGAMLKNDTRSLGCTPGFSSGKAHFKVRNTAAFNSRANQLTE